MIGMSVQNSWGQSLITVMARSICQLQYRSADKPIINTDKEVVLIQGKGLFATCSCYKY